jgi:hypothetical protein
MGVLFVKESSSRSGMESGILEKVGPAYIESSPIIIYYYCEKTMVRVY